MLSCVCREARRAGRPKGIAAAAAAAAAAPRPFAATRDAHVCSLPPRRRLHLSATCTPLYAAAQRWQWEVTIVIGSPGRNTDLAALDTWLQRHPGKWADGHDAELPWLGSATCTSEQSVSCLQAATCKWSCAEATRCSRSSSR